MTLTRLTSAAGPAALTLAAMLSFATPAATAAADPPAGGFCSQTAELLFQACGFESRDDLLVAQAKCLNLADDAARARCGRETRLAMVQAKRQCRAQRDWRLAGCTVLGEGRYDPVFTPDRFDSDFHHLSNPNPYFPLAIGQFWEYRGGTETNTVEVANEYKLIEGVTCIVLRDLVYDGGRLKEATDDWFAAGRDGSSWYCGEEVKDYESFKGDSPSRPELVSIDGSFKHGRDRDKAGLIMPALPQAGMAYLEEFSLGNAEDVSEIVAIDYHWGELPELDLLVPRELAQRLCNHDCVVTKNYSLLEPGVVALKYYARGIGFFLETEAAEGKSLQLVGCNFDPRCVGLPTP